MKDTEFMSRPRSSSGCRPAIGSIAPAPERAFFDDPGDSRGVRRPPSTAAGRGLVSTVDDYLAFCQMLLDMGRRGRERIL